MTAPSRFQVRKKDLTDRKSRPLNILFSQAYQKKLATLKLEFKYLSKINVSSWQPLLIHRRSAFHSLSTKRRERDKTYSNRDVTALV